ncbi:glycosyltransferase family 4 protein [Flavobacterium quisquiliarum]|uniref:Glycosyltransferase family 4 protein n=1 Tax=Flavobacterium quisquiliarum TaxID=1834436 RepID=A0ABV8W383_9FLAO|nr:glycosyltransferase family 1 protein [Flavobacterium quisquiliarum]MBW1655022.1 glycosyltransferase [Flavobacterium quisquiliarum]NWL02613.1 glycosyltransferase family 1 protein [Flavobacterium collinsii]
MIKEIILVGNYVPDKQYSMQIFEVLMAEGYRKSKFNVSTIRPDEILRKLAFNKNSLIKWLAYIDKFVLFPAKLLLLRFKNFILFKSVNYHICDHSNAFYLYFLPKNKTIITCHDVLAIRAGLGFSGTYCHATKSGQVLQKIILNALSGARKLATVSDFTLNQLIEIDNKPRITKNWITIHNAISEKFAPSSEDEVHKILDKFQQLKNKEIILHVGSDLERKNRKLLIHMIAELKNDWNGVLVLAGEPLNSELLNLIQELKVSDRIVQIHNPTNNEIIALYSICQAMIFPSYSEGFGWPIIEAQACGAPVITSNKAPMMNEVGGTAALYADPDNPSSFLDQFQKIRNKRFRNEIVIKGYENAKRFDFNNTVNQYVQLIKNEA